MRRKKNNCGIIIADEEYCDVLGKMLYIDEEIQKASIDLLCLYRHIEVACTIVECMYGKVERDTISIDRVNNIKEYVNKNLRYITHNVYRNLTDKVTEFAEILNKDISTDYYSLKELRVRLECLKRDCTLVYADILNDNYGPKPYIVELAKTVCDKGFDTSLLNILVSIKTVEAELLMRIITINSLFIKEKP